ncbi:hypothetical protein SBRCBS47491_001970 [Sporothrix bragantina]|uniref:PhoD-like phosphatase domain-containing protein n=1 Tax=Sporothrix bragantina TaxID=671064 RepID=A0ABP0B322_9PEZI
MTERHHPHFPHLHGDEADDMDNTNNAGGRNPYASANRWRHQESTAFARHAAASAGNGQPRDEENTRSDVKDLTAFLNASRITPSEAAAADGAGAAPKAKDSATNSPGSTSAARFTPIVVPGPIDAAAPGPPTTSDGNLKGMPSDGKVILVGPLLNYRRMEGDRWIGSALIVTRGGGKTQSFVPTTLLSSAADSKAEPKDAPVEDGSVTDGTGSGAKSAAGGAQRIEGICLYSDRRNTFWRFDLSVPMTEHESRWQYTFPDLRYASESKPRTSIFSVPAVTEAMRILFFSCNGFSVGTDEDAWSGPALWNDVIRYHAQRPFHVMIGGGDQIYNDSIRVSGPLREWTAISNPKKRRDFPFTEKLRAACDDFYLKNYIEWYSTEPFASTNGQIPQLNIWDDHDIIDGFGSYVNDFMKCDVFRGIGGTAHKYYMLFQHHLPPPASTYTSDAPQVAEEHKSDPVQLVDTYRLTWLENVFSSPLLGPVKFMNRRFGFGGGFFNDFDGSVDLLDDLDDHYTARTHKKERNWFIERLQVLSAENSVRITILGGDVHLAALGRFYANPDLNIASENDYRFMVNVVSSAITNKPPPAAIANLLARRNKIHHLNSSTDETLFKLFNKDPGETNKTASHNQVTMPSRNFAIITENSPNNAESDDRSRPRIAVPVAAEAPQPPVTAVAAPPPSRGSSRFRRRSASRRRDNGNNSIPPTSSTGQNGGGAATGESNGRNGHYALHAGEEGAGTEHKAAGEQHGRGNDGSLDVCIRVEINQHDPQGKTEPYGLTIPALRYTGPPPIPRVPHHFRPSRPNTGRHSTTTASS